MALEAPRSRVPSISACGLNHVTMHAVVKTFAMGISTSVESSNFVLERIMENPIYITTSEPIPMTVSSSHLDVLMMAPAPKKHATDSVISKNIIINAVMYAKKCRNKVVGLTGYSGGKLKELSDYSLHVPIDNMQIAEDVHIIFNHLMMYILAYGEC